MYYTDVIQQIFGKFSEFVTANQFLIGLVLLLGSYFLKRFIDHKAADPAINIYDSIKPGSDAFYAMVHKAIDYKAKLNPMGSAAKLEEYLAKIQEFEAMFKIDKLKAIQSLIAWYLSIKGKVEKISANPSTGLPESMKDSPAQ